MNSFLDTQLLVGASILGEVAIGYAPMIDADRQITATRLTVVPLQAGGDIDAPRLLETLIEARIAETSRISLHADSEALMQDLPTCRPDLNFMIEVPAAIAADGRYARGLRQMHEYGNTLLLHDGGRGSSPAGVLDCFAYLVKTFDPLAGTPLAYQASFSGMATVRSGIGSVADLELSFKTGAQAVFGWPLDVVTTATKRSKMRHELTVIVELIALVDAEEPIDRLEQTLRRDPALAFHLLRYMNSATFGLRKEIVSFRQAIMMLGYSKLKRWLALLLVASGTPIQACPLKFAAVRRGLLMSELVRFGGDPDLAGDLFICGAFSLLDRMLGERPGDLFSTVRVSVDVHRALVDHGGTYRPFLDLVHAIEAASTAEILRCAGALSIGIQEVNRATLRALATASAM